MIGRVPGDAHDRSLLQRVLFFSCLSAIILWAGPAAAQGLDIGLGYAEIIGLPTLDIRDIVAQVIRAALGFVGFIMVIKILQAGFLIMTAGSSEDRKTEAREAMKGAVIGMMIIMMSTAIAKFIIDAIAQASYNYL